MLFFYHSKTKLLLLISLSPVSFPFNFLNIQNREWSILIVNIRHWNICFFVCLFVLFFSGDFSSPVNVCFDFNISNLLFFTFYRFFLYFYFGSRVIFCFEMYQLLPYFNQWSYDANSCRPPVESSPTLFAFSNKKYVKTFRFWKQACFERQAL